MQAGTHTSNIYSQYFGTFLAMSEQKYPIWFRYCLASAVLHTQAPDKGWIPYLRGSPPTIIMNFESSVFLIYGLSLLDPAPESHPEVLTLYLGCISIDSTHRQSNHPLHEPYQNDLFVSRGPGKVASLAGAFLRSIVEVFFPCVGCAVLMFEFDSLSLTVLLLPLQLVNMGSIVGIHDERAACLIFTSKTKVVGNHDGNCTSDFILPMNG